MQTALHYIGTDHYGCDGFDEYWKLTTAMPKEEVEKIYSEFFYRDTDTPGAIFCHRITVMAYPGRDDAYIIIVHRRYNN
jgi:hypothetical protein